MSAVLKKTTCPALQAQLDQWVTLVDMAISCTNPSTERADAIMAFCKVFVPADVSEDDIDHFSGMLSSDEVRWFDKFFYVTLDALGLLCRDQTMRYTRRLI